MQRSAAPRKRKSKPFKGVRMQQTKPQPLFSLGQIVATPGALATLEKARQPAQEFLSRHVRGEWATFVKKTAGKTSSAWSAGSGSSAVIEQTSARDSMSSPKPTAV